MTKQAKQAIKKGEWVPILCLVDEDIAKLRCSMAFSRREYKRPRHGDELDFHDYLCCLTKLSTLYSEAGQQNLAMQTTKLVHAALVESASKTRASVIRACERLRKQTTSPSVNWDSDSLERHDIRVLLEDLQKKEKPSRKKESWREPGKEQRLRCGKKRRLEGASFDGYTKCGCMCPLGSREIMSI